MSAGRLLREARRAAKLVQGEVAVPPLQIDAGGLHELGVPEQDVQTIVAGSAREQIRLLRPHLDRYVRRQKEGKVEKARKLAQRHADELVRSAHRVKEGVEVMPDHLAGLAGVVGIDTLQLTDEAPVVLPRLFLKRVMASLVGTKVRAVVEPNGLRLRYTTRAGGGEMFLAGVRVPRGELYVINLQPVGRPRLVEKGPGMAPTNGRQRRAPSTPSQGHPFLSGLVEAVVELLAA